MQTLLLWMFYISSLYAFLPALLSRLLGFRVFRRGKSEHEYALTFDDGPDPVYTPQLLDLLKRFEAKATFFVVGVHAEQYPELLKRMHDEGHLIGIHNYVHQSNWLMRPTTVRKQIARTERIIRQITGEGSLFYRPPWGIVNFSDISAWNDRRIVLWSSMFGDWRLSIGVEELTKRMLNKLKGGEIMLLHDCGMTLGADREAPGQMLLALEQVLKEADIQNLRSVRIDSLLDRQGQVSAISSTEATPALSWWKRALVSVWLSYEQVFHAVFRLDTTSDQDVIFHYRLCKYRGRAVPLTDGTSLQKGDAVVELHLDNRRLFQLASTAKSMVHLAIQLIRSVEKELPDLANRIANDPRLSKAKALYGVSIIHKGPEHFGFQMYELNPGLTAKTTTMYLRLLLRVIHPLGQNRLKDQPQDLIPKLMVMPMDTLLSRFLQTVDTQSSLVPVGGISEGTTSQ